MKRLASIILALLFAFSICGCDAPRTRSVRRRAPQHHSVQKQVNVTHLPDGRYVYRDDSGMFWFYMYMLNSSSSPSYYTSSGSMSSLPRGGAWVSASSAPGVTNIAEVEAAAAQGQSVSQSIEATTAGEPYSFSDLQADQASFGDNGVDAHADGMADSPDAGGGDVGGGGDTGGGGDAGGGGGSGGGGGGGSGGGGGGSGGGGGGGGC